MVDPFVAIEEVMNAAVVLRTAALRLESLRKAQGVRDERVNRLRGTATDLDALAAGLADEMRKGTSTGRRRKVRGGE